MIEVLLFRLFTEPDLHQAVIKHRQQLKWVATHGRDDGLYDVLDTILRYDEQYGKLPEKPTALLQFCDTSSDALLMQRSEALRPDLKRMKEVATSELRAEFTDIDVLIDYTVAEARKRYHTYVYERAKSIVNQGPSASKDDPTGPDGALAFVRKYWSYDLSPVATSVAGIWQDNTETLEQQLADYRTKQKEQRVRFGFPQIDEHWVALWGKSVFIAGSSGDGKSTFLHSAVYNMARAGERILYVSLEFKPAEIWEFLAFIHTHQYRDRMFLPAQSVWQQGNATDEDHKNMSLVIEDIKQRTTVPGLIDVQQFFTWDEIEQYWEANNAKNQYTVVVVDYLYKLNVPTSGKYAGDIAIAKNALVSRVINWCHQLGSFVFISPSQVNREAHKAAKKDGGGYDLDSLYACSAIQQDADLVMSLLSTDESKAINSLMVKCLKFRGTERFPEHDLRLDPRTKYVQDGKEYLADLKERNAKAVREMWERQHGKGAPDVIESLVTMPDTEVL
jgi:hypothetical protein